MFVKFSVLVYFCFFSSLDGNIDTFFPVILRKMEI